MIVMINQIKFKAFSKSAEALEEFVKDLQSVYQDGINYSRIIKSDTDNQYFILGNIFVEEPRQ